MVNDTLITKAHIIKLYPTEEQEYLLKKSCGVARFTYNWALNKWQEDYQKGIKNDAYGLIKYLNSIKKEQYPWMLDVSKTCCQYPIHDLENAFKKMWKGLSRYPKFKKKGVKDSFVAVENKESFKQKDYKIRLPRIGWVKCAENLRFEGVVNNVTVKRVANFWVAIINIKTCHKLSPNKKHGTVGVDFGVKTLLVLSDGNTFENPKALKSNLKTLKRLQRGLSRKQSGSNNKKKQQIRLSKKHYKVSCIRKSAIHEATSFISKNYNKVVIETLRPKNMVKSRIMSQVVSDASFGEVARQLQYKCQWEQVELIRADQMFPSSKICSSCGHKKDVLLLSERVFKCENCGAEIDRDLNASKNLANYSPTPEFGESQACGVANPSLVTKNRATKKQEVSKTTYLKPLLTLLLVIPLFSWGQEKKDKWYIPHKEDFRINKNDRRVMCCFFGYGFVKGWGDQIEYHHFEMSKQFPGLFKNGNHFWDGRYDEDGIWDAKHLCAGLQASLMTAAVCFKVGDYKKYPKNRRFWKITADIIKYDFSRRLGFFISYNLINKNQLFK